MTENLGTIPCEAAITTDGTLVITPQPGVALDRLSKFHSGESVAQWDSAQAPSGNTYNPLLVTLRTGEHAISAALVMSPTLWEAVPSGVVHVQLVLSEVADPSDPAMSAADVIRFDAPPLRDDDPI